MAKLPLDPNAPLLYLSHEPDRELSGSEAVRLYDHRRATYEMLLVPTVVCPADVALGNSLTRLRDSGPLSSQRNATKGALQQRAAIPSQPSAKAARLPAQNLTEKLTPLKKELLSLFHFLPLDGFEVQQCIPLCLEGETKYILKSWSSSKCRFQRRAHRSPDNKNYLIVEHNGTVTLKCYAPKCKSRGVSLKHPIHGKGIYSRLYDSLNQS